MSTTTSLEAGGADTRFVSEFLAWQQNVKRRSVGTIYTYQQTYQALLKWMAPNHRALGTVTADDLVAFTQRPRRRYKGAEGQAAAATITREMMALSSLFKWLAANGKIDADPTPTMRDSVPKVENEAPNPVDMKLWRKLWGSDLSDGDRVAFGLGFFMGLRRHEATMLRPDQVVDDGSTVILSGIKRKGVKKADPLPLSSALSVWMRHYPDLLGHPDRLLSPLRRLLAERPCEPCVLPWAEARPFHAVERDRQLGAPEGAIAPDQFNKHLIRAQRHLGMDSDFCTPHMLRHGFGTYFCAADVPVQVVSKMMGHRSLAVTMRYVDVGKDPLAKYGLADELAPVRRF